MSAAADRRRRTTTIASPTDYEAERHHGYHRLIDELELDLIRRYGAGKDVFEAGCGTGLLLRQAATVARSAVGLDLSRGMLRPARARGLHVVQGSLTDVPLPSASFDLVYSMKVLAHVPPIARAVAELARLGRPGGHLLLEFYNPLVAALPGQARRRPGTDRRGTNESHVFTRFDTLAARALLPASGRRAASASAASGCSRPARTCSRSRRWARCSPGPSGSPATRRCSATWAGS